ncbi:MAG: hypothetical protein ABI178_15005 [Rhodanobacter sp.]
MQNCRETAQCGKAWSTAMLFSAAIVLTGCASMPSLSGPSQDFVTAVNTLAQAEADYFDEIQAASDAGYRMQATADYVGHNGTFAQVSQELSKHDDFSRAKKLRVAAMAQLQNYAQQISAITSGSSTSWIAEDAKTTTTDLSTLIKDTGDSAASQLLTSHAGTIETAVTMLGQAIVDNQSAKVVQALAQEAKGPIAKIAEMVTQDNVNIEKDQFTASLHADQTQSLQNVLHYIYDDPKVNAFERFTAIQTTATWKESLVTKGQAIQKALEKLQAANDALARKEDTSSRSLMQQAYAYAEQALSAPAAQAAVRARQGARDDH